ncbi:MAG: putative cobaltochelatase [Elusimicrobia bacterium]|nr:putative cobaltochelatase [Elusimicrobiota bacterium]
MSCRKTIFPFTAIVGQEKMKKALILNAINSLLGGVLIRGEKGTAKSTAARSLADLLPEIDVVEDCPFGCNPHNIYEMCVKCRERFEKGEKLPVVKRKIKVVDLPLGATEDRVLGTLDIEKAIKKGEKDFEPGLLAKVNRGILYVDEVNLLDDHLVDILLDAAAMGVNIVEREGVSYSHPAKFILVGTMNPEEGELRPQLLDRFGLCVEVHGLTDPEKRAEVVKRCIEYEKSPHEFEKKWEQEQINLRETIIKAQDIFPYVIYSNDILKLVTQIAIDMGVDGHRADIAMIKTAQTIAAYHQRKEVTEEDVKEAAELVLPHRMRKKPFQQPQPNQEKIEQSIKKQKEEKHQHKNTKSPTQDSEQQNEKNNNKSPESNTSQEVNFETGKTFSVKKLQQEKDRIIRNISGRRSNTKTNSKSGRYVRSKIPEHRSTSAQVHKFNDIAFDATLRAAAPYQISRQSIVNSPQNENCGLIIEPQDIRQRVREKKTGNAIIFVVDSSGSMGANERMTETKGAILSLLIDAYQKRDRVGFVAFKGDKAEILLPLTSSIELAKKRLEELPTGGKTPLSKGLLTGYELFQNELRKTPNVKPLLVLITDGKANVGIGKENIFEEVKNIAGKIKKSGINSIVIDTESSFISFNKSLEIADALGGKYYRLEDLTVNNIVKTVEEFIKT